MRFRASVLVRLLDFYYIIIDILATITKLVIITACVHTLGTEDILISCYNIVMNENTTPRVYCSMLLITNIFI